MGLRNLGETEGPGMNSERTHIRTAAAGGGGDRGYRLRLVNIDCMRESVHFNVVMDLTETIADLLPYLAALLPNCTYGHGSGVINVMDGGHIVGIYPERITITDVTRSDQAEALCARYFGLIEQARSGIGSIQPVFQTAPKRSVLELYRELPKTNCGQCGHATCLAFAAALYRGEAARNACPPPSPRRDPGRRRRPARSEPTATLKPAGHPPGR